MKQLLFFVSISALICTGCKKNNITPAPSQQVYKDFISFDLRVSWVGSYNSSTSLFELTPESAGFISLKNKQVYKYKNNEAGTHQGDIDFIYTVSGSGRTGYFSNPAYIKSQYGTTVFGWSTWNAKSLIAEAHSLKVDQDGSTVFALSDEEFDAINSPESMKSIVNFGDNVSVPLDESQKLTDISSFNIYLDGAVDDTYYFSFIDAAGRPGVFRIQKNDDASSVSVKVKMLV